MSEKGKFKNYIKIRGASEHNLKMWMLIFQEMH